MKIATLGPQGTFSHEATLKYNKGASILFTNTIRNVFEAVVDNKADLGIVPIENSIAGTVDQTLDYLIEFNIKIKAEEILPISHNLIGFGKIKDIKVLYLHPQTYEQCELFIKKILPKVKVTYTSSNGKSAELITKSKGKNKAAIVPKIAVDIYKLKILKKDVQDTKFNVTRFFIIGKEYNKMADNCKTTIAIHPQVDRPGLLYEMLGQFAKRKINLTKIESRPSKGKLGDYIFYIDFEGHRTEKHVAEALKKLEETAFVRVLGSYPRKY